MSFVETESAWLRTILPEILKNGRLVDNYDNSKDDSFHIDSIDIKLIDSSEAFMMTQCYRARCLFEYNGKKEERKLVVKKTPKSPEELYKAARFEEMFTNEIEFYSNILPKLQTMTSGKFVATKYFYSEIKPFSAVIILQDFGVKGWRVTKDKVGLSLEHARLAVKYLGKFNGFCYAFKHNNNEKFEEITKKLKEPRYGDSPIPAYWELMLKTSKQRVLKVTREYQPQVDEEYVKKWMEITDDEMEYGRKCVVPREPMAILCHGDFLRNNVAYKYKDGDDTIPTDFMMFDYQTLRLSSPMIDLSVFLAISTFAEVRDLHFESLFDDYYAAVKDNYEKFAKKTIPEFLSRDNLLREYIRWLPYSISITAYFLGILVDPVGSSPEDMLYENRTEEEIIEDGMTHGGEIVDREIAHQMKEMFDFCQQYNIDITENSE